MLKASLRKHGPAHVHLLRFFHHRYFFGTYTFLGVLCSCKPFKMAGGGFGVTPMSRLSQHSRRPHTGKPLDLSSPKKKAPKRKTLSSRYSAILPSKRRRLGLNTIRDPAISLGESHQAPEECHAGVSSKACNASEVLSKEKESRHSGTRGRGRKAKAKGKARPRGANARIKTSRGLQAEVCPLAKLLDSEDISNEEGHSVTDLFHLDATPEVGFFSEGNHNGSSIPSLPENVNSKVVSWVLETSEAGALHLVKPNDSDTAHAEPRRSIEKHTVVANRGPGRKSSKRSATFEPSVTGLRASKDYDSNEINIPKLTGSRVQEFSGQDRREGTSFPTQDPLPLEGSFLRPRRKSKKKSKLEEHCLPPPDYVGKRVVVYWPHAKAWYAGTVIMYDGISKKHKIKYDDSDEECISFRRHKVILEKSLSTQLADGQNKGVLPVHRADPEEVGASKPVQGDQADERCVVEDNVLLSSFVPRHRVREGSHETIYDGSMAHIGAVKGLDASTTDNTIALKPSKKSISLATQDNTGRTPSTNKGNSAGKEAFVYVRRTKGRRKVDAPSRDTALDGKTLESKSATTVTEQGTSRKRKSRQSCLQQTVQGEFPDCNSYDDQSNFSDAPIRCGTHENVSNAFERGARKRPKRSLKKLVSQASIAIGIKISQEPKPLQDELRKQRARRTRGKLARKHKLINAHFTARNIRLPTKRVLCLADDSLGQTFEGSSLNFCHNKAKLYHLEVPAIDMLKPESVSLFAGTIYLMLPPIAPDLFTWQLFTILTCMHFCDGGSFDDTFSLNGSLRDWMGIFRIFLCVIKAVPLSAYMNGRQWQCIILHKFWKSIQRCEPAEVDTLVSLPHEVETLVSEHLLDASVKCGVTNREIMNLFVCFFIKPYICALICEKGVSVQVAVQQFLLHIRSKDRGITCLQQSVELFPLLPSSGSADKGFSSYLMLFLRSTNWCKEGALFLRQMEEWSTETRLVGCAESWSPILSIKKVDNLVWQVIATDVVNGSYAVDELKHKTSRKIKLLRLEQEDTEFEFLDKLCFKCSRYARTRNSWSLSSGPHNGRCLNSALLFTARLQKRLNVTFGKELGSTEVSCHPTTVSLLTEEHVEGTKLIGQSVSGAKGAPEFRFSSGLSNVVTREELSAGLSNVVIREDLPTLPSWKSSLPIMNASAKHAKVEPDSNLSWRNSSITTDSNTAGIKEESSVDTNVCQEPLHSLCLKSNFVGQKPVGFHIKTDGQHFSGQMDQDYYESKNVKMVTKGRPRYHAERQWPLLKKRPTYFCIADLLFQSNDCVESAFGARVELQSKVDHSFLIAVHADGKSLEQNVREGRMLAKNPPELSWKSGSGWSLEFSDREQWGLFRCMYNELCSQAMRSTCVKEIPIPVVKETEALYVEAQARSSLRPFFAIKSSGQEIDTAYRCGRVLYDLDSDDESWMAEINRVSRDSLSEIITDNTLEQIIDRLEKEAYRRGEETVTVHDAIELCQGVAVAESVRAVHTYWSSKRLAKGMSLLRYFQPPLWEQYQEELRAWENKMQQYSPDIQNTLIDRYPQPIMSAFCLQSRSFDTLDNGKRMLRQRSQKKIRPTSRSSSEDSQKLSVYLDCDSTRHLTRDSECPLSTTSSYQHLDHGQEEGLPDSAKGAREKSTEARRVAESKALKLQRRFLEFDMLLQKAWAFLIEYTVSGGDASAQSEALEGRMVRLFTGCSSLFSGVDDSSEDEPPSGQVCRDVSEEFLEAFSKKCSLNGRVGLCKGQFKAGDDFEDASPLLPFLVKGSSYAWNGSFLLKKCG